MKRLFLLTTVIVFIGSLSWATDRKESLLNDNWEVFPHYDVSKRPPKQKVTLPHTWNLNDVYDGMKYDRSTYIYERPFVKDASLQGKRVFLRFDAVNTYADVYVNQHYVGCHKGGYTAFCFEITKHLQDGDNKLAVVASNAYRTDCAPLSGDFNVYGGITRPVHLIITGEDCISPLDHASTGVYIHQDKVSAQQAAFTVETILSLTSGKKGHTLRTSLLDADGKEVLKQETPVGSADMRQAFTLQNPRLWNGRKDPYQYTVRVELLRDGQVIDQVEEQTGFRFFHVDVDKGFFLNGVALDLHGVCRHEEAFGTATLYNEKALEEDAKIIYDLGSTGVRYVHYPHSKYDVVQYDRNGIVLWYELNLAGPGGYASPGYVKNPEFEASVMQNLEEMIKQNYNSPAICFWSLCNELSFKYDEPATFLKQLNAKAKALDPQRLTTFAICYDQDKFQGITDVLGWNKYFGWYNSQGGIGTFMDQAKIDAAGQPLGVCEYGAAGSPNQHGYEKIVSNKIHLEEYQARVHEDNWMQMVTRPYIWCKFIWQYSDNPSSIRDEGDRKGINDKGIVTHDRKIFKDSYYFYQANWSENPMLYISARRYTQRTEPTTMVKIYTNQPTATLYVNGKKIGKAKNDKLGRIVFENVKLKEGENAIEVRSGKLTDRCTWTYNPNAKGENNKNAGGKLDGAV